MTWVINVENKDFDTYQAPDSSIYRVPMSTLELNKKAYTPKLVSFGPYHYREDHLRAMQEHKKRTLLHFLKGAKEPLRSIVDSLVAVLLELQNSYDSLSKEWRDTDSFVELMVVDGCFMLEILSAASGSQYEDDYGDQDPVFGSHGKHHVMPSIRRDMLLMENQLPMLVLVKLSMASSGSNDEVGVEQNLHKQILSFCNSFESNTQRQYTNCRHVLDLYHRSQFGPPERTMKAQPSTFASQESWGIRPLHFDRDKHGAVIFHATMLHDDGLKIKPRDTAYLNDISFDGGVLNLPVFIVDDMTESTLLNLVAFERCHVGAGNDVSSFLRFMDKIVDDEQDIRLLRKLGVLRNRTGTDRSAADLFNTMTKSLTTDTKNELNGVQAEMVKYRKSRRHRIKAHLWQAYYFFFGARSHFRRNWAIISIIVAIFFVSLEIIQTVFAILQYQQGQNK
ncbi:hypothetical protein NMG60_11034564 [Bertholletia excelsa]